MNFTGKMKTQQQKSFDIQRQFQHSTTCSKNMIHTYMWLKSWKVILIWSHTQKDEPNYCLKTFQPRPHDAGLKFLSVRQGIC